MSLYPRIFALVNRVCPFLLPTQAANLALLVQALLLKRTLNLTALARTYPRPVQRLVPHPKHDLLHRLKRLSRFLSNDQVDTLAVQVAFIPPVIARLGLPQRLGVVIDWTSFAVTLPGLVGGGVRHYEVLTIGVPRCGRVLPLLTVTYERGHWGPFDSRNQCEEAALAMVLAALPFGVRPVVIADRGFGRASFLHWLQQRRVDYVVRLCRGGVITTAGGRQWKLGQDRIVPGEQRWAAHVRYGLHHGRPRDLWINLASSWRRPPRRRRGKVPQEGTEAWHLATSLATCASAVAWYAQRMWIEETFRDYHHRFGVQDVEVSTAARLDRLVMAVSLAVAWLHLMALPGMGVLPRHWQQAVVTHGTASVLTLALEFLDHCRTFPSILPRAG